METAALTTYLRQLHGRVQSLQKDLDLERITYADVQTIAKKFKSDMLYYSLSPAGCSHENACLFDDMYHILDRILNDYADTVILSDSE